MTPGPSSRRRRVPTNTRTLLGSGAAGTILSPLAPTSASARCDTRDGPAVAAKEHADEAVEAGREPVEAHVEFIHDVERLHQDVVDSL